MPRGRHRHSPPLHKLLPPSAVAGASAVCAVGAWLFADPLVLRLLVAAAAAAAVTGAVIMRGWDRAAGRKVAELGRMRTADQWKAEERLAELESDLEESRELRARLDTKLRAKRVELAALRGEHAELLRRYATAETERASALEGRRQLALEAAAPVKELTAAGSTPTPDAYRRAARALKDLPRNAAAQEARRTAEAARSRDLAERAREAEEPQGKHAAAAGTEQHARPTAALPAAQAAPAAAPAMRPVPAAAAIAPYAARRPAPRPEGTFDFFGTQGGQAGQAGRAVKALQGAQKAVAAIEAVQNEDLADVVGEEVLAEAEARQPAPERVIGQVIDLTAHDETEQLDVAELRGAVNS
ncbi:MULTISPECIES: hypothetical protein [Streptomyces]|uniref:Secreted protein n=1 Tax=Streptomyces solicathayae TaxID=3081768 RepID=A0ABZ0LU05_9ACTN|nr:hypothetical protein [Streptomyces sp. HUAS YS2]WOX22924.1 hypothetical protein R2D22_16570 [Streptomyces sp. HUAS YS2]